MSPLLSRLWQWNVHRVIDMLKFIFSTGQHKLRGLRNAVLIIVVLVLPPVTLADIDWSSADWGGYSVDSLSYWSYADMSRRTAEQARARSTPQRGQSANPAPRKSPESALSTADNVLPSGAFKDGRGLAQLAELHAGEQSREQRMARRAQYRQIVQGFNQNVEKLYGLPANNLATGMTVVMAGAYSAYQNRRFPDAWVKPLYQQMEGMLLQDPRLPKRSAAQKAADYQIMVGAGMAMMLTQAELEKAPNPAALKQLRDTGRDALRTLFNADPQSVEFSSAGLRVR